MTLSDAQLRDQAVACLQKTTDSYPTWVRKGKPAASNWAKAFALLAQIGAATPIPLFVNPVPPPASGVYFGEYIEGVQTFAHYFPAGMPWSNAPLQDPGTSDSWAKVEADAGKKVALLMFGQPNPWLEPFQQVYFDACAARGATPVLDMSTGSTPLADITSGEYDVQITAWAMAAKAWGKPFVLRLDAEMNGSWYDFGAQSHKNPGLFVAMWRHFHDLFVAAGATNVSWHWCPNVDPESVQTPLEQLYPGDAYVDWIGMTGYSHDGESFHWVFDSTYARLVKLAPSKPIMIGEMGSDDVATGAAAGEKAQWIKDFFAAIGPGGSMPQVKAFCWFNWYILENGRYWSWPIESSADALAAFKAGVASSYIIGRP